MHNFKDYIIEKLKINKDSKDIDYKEVIINFLSKFDYFNEKIKDEYELEFHSENGKEWYSVDWTKSRHGDNRVNLPEEAFMNQLKENWYNGCKRIFMHASISSRGHGINFIIKYE